MQARQRGFADSRVGPATGTNFPDALAGGAAIGQLNGFLLLSQPDYLSPEAGTVISEHRAAIGELRYFGGENVFGPRPRDEPMFVLTSGYWAHEPLDGPRGKHPRGPFACRPPALQSDSPRGSARGR